MRALELLPPHVATAKPQEPLLRTVERDASHAATLDVGDNAAGALEVILSIDEVLAGLSRELAETAALLTRQREREPHRRP
jgi:hypothetical protein